MILTVFKIILILYLFLCIFFIAFWEWKKSIAFMRWSGIVLFLGLFGLTEFVMFFPAWWTRKTPVVKWLFWIWLDDSRLSDIRESGYAEDYENELNGKKETIWTSYLWHIRNRVWNLDTLINGRKRKRKTVETVIDHLYMGGVLVNQDLKWIPMARLKYWKNGKEGSNINSGNKISFNHSIFGEGYLWETIGKRLTFRYSYLKKIFFGKLWLNLVFGENDKRNVFTIKLKRNKQIL